MSGIVPSSLRRYKRHCSVDAGWITGIEIVISSAVTLSFGMCLRGACVSGVMAAIIPISWNVPVPSIVATL